MKKYSKILILILLSFFLNTKVEANSYTCEYDEYGIEISYDEAGTPDISQTKYTEKETPIVLNFFWNVESGNIKTTNKLDVLEKDYIGSCPRSMYVCIYEYKGYANLGTGIEDGITDDVKGIGYANRKEVYLFSSESEMKKDPIIGDLPNKVVVKGNEVADDFMLGYDFITEDLGCDDSNILCAGAGDLAGLISGIIGTGVEFVGESITMYYEKYKNCNTTNYTGDLMTFNLACPNLQSYKNKFNDSIGEYKNCSNDLVCKSKAITNINEKEDLIKSYCKSILAEQNFDGATEQECLLDCLDIGVQTKKAKVAAGIISGDSGECGFSGRLLVWISNILRWIKYILPVIVIVMGIIDFIKAIAADKEDEMKKAQGAFVKRLIAAALVFIIPLIIEFILDKMGFGYNDCGIFDK